MSSSSSSSSSSETPAVDICADGLVRVQLTPLFQKNYISSKTSGFRIRVDVTDSCNLDSENIFRHYKYPDSQLFGVANTEFTGVCSWPDMQEFPEDDPREEDLPQVFRLDHFDIIVRSESIATEIWDIVQEEVAELMTTIEDGGTLEAGTAVWLGAAIDG